MMVDRDSTKVYNPLRDISMDSALAGSRPAG